MKTQRRSVWSLAGHDPFGGAGIQADMRVAEAHDIPLRTLITTYTAQNDSTFLHAEAVNTDLLEKQWTVLQLAERPAAIKIGLMLGEETVRWLAQRAGETPLILDPVLASSSGKSFVSEHLLSSLREYLWTKVSLLTPNREEAAMLVGYSLTDLASVKKAAKDLRAQGLKAVLIKGGHSEGNELFDYFDDGERPFVLKATRCPGEYRGTGCTMSTAIACAIAQGHSLREAVVLAHSYVQAAIQKAFEMKRNHLPGVSHKPRLSALYYDEVFDVNFEAMPRPVAFYTVAPNASWVERLAKAGVPTLQLRAKEVPASDILDEVEKAKSSCEEHGSLFFLNDDWRLAVKMKAFGVHLGQEDLDALRADDLLMIAGSGLRLGISTHSIEEAARARALNPSYIALGPVFETTCKSMRFGPQGMERVSEWVERLPGIPVVAIGGLKREHAESLLARGVDGIAVISDVTEAKDPESRVNEWRNAWPS